MTKAEKDMGIIPPKYRTARAKPTPAMPPRRVRGKYGYTSVHQIGRRQSTYTRWFTTEAARDQSYATVMKNDHMRSFFVSCDKVERDIPDRVRCNRCKIPFGDPFKHSGACDNVIHGIRCMGIAERY